MKSLRLLAAAAVLLAVGFAPAPFPRPDRRGADPTAVAGAWQFTLWEHNGVSSDSGKQYTIEMTKEKFDFVYATNNGRTSYGMRLDPTVVPHAFEWTMGGRVSYVGSYKLEREQITMIFASGQQLAARPTDFGGKPEFRFVLRRLRRD